MQGGPTGFYIGNGEICCLRDVLLKKKEILPTAYKILQLTFQFPEVKFSWTTLYTLWDDRKCGVFAQFGLGIFPLRRLGSQSRFRSFVRPKDDV